MQIVHTFSEACSIIAAGADLHIAWSWKVHLCSGQIRAENDAGNGAANKAIFVLFILCCRKQGQPSICRGWTFKQKNLDFRYWLYRKIKRCWYPSLLFAEKWSISIKSETVLETSAKHSRLNRSIKFSWRISNFNVPLTTYIPLSLRYPNPLRTMNIL